eukprot:CAMPEP_0201517536 /NCGR_PEP_ID=MMETSP0161_2-20130828/8617_1 /ASSEMBLY_ACC=CAM_ASM_000251 /TAXON_ID=180227 /ORGANISM="Neoparamoeba aestuarina, Strain SoJaBio B1-5/56/2" /LENGTH=383 /DNA_ID=CAMNT_0047915065 /DNA_START=347 /DNA_END=1495 /DNA_ORIENTATION=+
MTQLQKVAPTPDWVFVTGDYSAHGLTGVGNYTLEAITNVTQALQAVYPQSNIYFCFGNNDVPEINYNIDCSADWFNTIYELWGDYIPEDQKDSFLTRGAYKVNLSYSFPSSNASAEKSKLWLIVLNTLFYSTRSNHQHEADPCGQFEWLETQLFEANKAGAKVYLMSHIMPGIDSYKFISLWETHFNDQFFATVLPYSEIIVGQFYGHVHVDEYRAFNDVGESRKKERERKRGKEGEREGQGKREEETPTPIYNSLINSAVSPVYGNNPNFRVATYSQSNFSVIDYHIWAMNLEESNIAHNPVWKYYYSFEDAYGVGSPDHDGIEDFNSKIINSYDTFALWYQHRSSGSTGDYAPEEGSLGWGCLICAVDAENVHEFNECLSN